MQTSRIPASEVSPIARHIESTEVGPLPAASVWVSATPMTRTPVGVSFCPLYFLAARAAAQSLAKLASLEIDSGQQSSRLNVRRSFTHLHGQSCIIDARALLSHENCGSTSSSPLTGSGSRS